MIVCARFWRRLLREQEREKQFGNVDGKSGGRHTSKEDIREHTNIVSAGGFTYLAGGGSHLGNVYAFITERKVLSLCFTVPCYDAGNLCIAST